MSSSFWSSGQWTHAPSIAGLPDDDAVTARPFRVIERDIRRLEHGLARRAGRWEGCHACGQRDGAEGSAAMMHLDQLDRSAQALRSFARIFQRRVWKDQGELFAAVTARHIFS